LQCQNGRIIIIDLLIRKFAQEQGNLKQGAIFTDLLKGKFCTRTGELETVSNLHRSPEREGCAANHICEQKMGELEVVSICRSRERKVSMKNHTFEMSIGQLGAASTMCKMMTPWTRKLTDTMQKFLSQKVHSCQWKEIDLNAVHPNSFDWRQLQDFLGTGR
jgi:hypothetical protein